MSYVSVVPRSLCQSQIGLRLADKRSLPCPRRNVWLAARDELYEEIMTKAWNPQLKAFGQSYEEKGVLDSSVLIMPLVFFMTPVRTMVLLCGLMNGAVTRGLI